MIVEYKAASAPHGKAIIVIRFVIDGNAVCLFLFYHHYFFYLIIIFFGGEGGKILRFIYANFFNVYVDTRIIVFSFSSSFLFKTIVPHTPIVDYNIFHQVDMLLCAVVNVSEER